jgi:hypothetical protein
VEPQQPTTSVRDWISAADAATVSRFWQFIFENFKQDYRLLILIFQKGDRYDIY